ncbi:putative porin [Hymenobacter cellulosivorans]|uniref:Porin n=1 Tax=Hymenobacter cellulosivorans TaxID=2932249 RepID=A0ABY4F5Y2_9BACT|nr:putative porin [Hymenobacter cellulosivorans]UOQ51889.1 putative porin [Hymenobacter cellulosivorans]
MSDLLVPLASFRFFHRVSFVLLLGLLLWPALLRAQVLDDSTKVIYGAKTTRVLYEADIMREQYEGRVIDTTLTNQVRDRYWFHDTTFQQDLGNIGTASRRLLWEPNNGIGARYGRTVFDKFARNSAEIPYYDTRSPFTFFRFIQSAVGEQVFELSYSRSLGRNLNVGLAYERFASRKVIAANGRENLTEHSNVLLFARYQTQDDRYHALFNINTARHRVPEQGGISYGPTDRIEEGDRKGAPRPGSLFGYDLEDVRLERSLNIDDRDEIRLVQTLRLLGRGLTAYHIFDWKRQFNNYTDRPRNGPLPVNATTGLLQFYNSEPRLNANLTNDRSEYRQLENEVGVMGHTPAVGYRLYGRYRNANLFTKNVQNRYLSRGDSIPYQLRYGQIFLGGTASFRYRDLVAVETAGEILGPQVAGDQSKAFSEYWFRGTARLGPLSGEFYSSSYSPTLTQQRFEGNHYAWDHTRNSGAEFQNTLVNQLTGRLNQQLGRHHLEASGSFVTINDLVYYNQAAVPAQLDEAKVLLIGTLRHRFNLGKFFFDNLGTGTLGGEDEGLRIPKLVANSRAYYQGYLFKKAMFSQIGADVYFQSRFKGYDYNPTTQQFYLQDHFSIRSYAVADVFLVTDIKTVSVFLKMAYINQGLYNTGNGYFATPLYTGLPRRFQFGIRWQFFD